jgi:hypothetical protein
VRGKLHLLAIVLTITCAYDPKVPDCAIACVDDAGCPGSLTCHNGRCSATTCAPPCANGRRDDAETDVDCGGPSCGPCDVAKACAAPRDCATANCYLAVCELAPLAWTSGPEMMLARSTFALASHGGLLYAFGGGALCSPPGSTESCMERQEAFDPLESRWELLPPSAALEPFDVWGDVTTVATEKAVYLFGGSNRFGNGSNKILAFVPQTNTFFEAAPMNVGRFGHSTALHPVDGTIWTMGGSTNDHNTRCSTAVEIFTPPAVPVKGAGTVTAAPAVPGQRCGVAAFVPNGTLLAIGGSETGGPLDLTAADVLSLTPGAASWTRGASLPSRRDRVAAVTAPDGRVYAAGGIATATGAALAEVIAYSADSRRWLQVPALARKRDRPAAAVGPDGRVYVMGGAEAPFQRTMEIYGPAFELRPDAAPAGIVVTAQSRPGAPFARDAPVRVELVSPRMTLATGQTDAQGQLPGGLTFRVPMVATGMYEVEIVDARSRYPVRARFFVQ